MTDIVNCWIIYVLKLEDGCWYVGQTTTQAFRQRMHHHWDHASKGAMWTRAHKPIRVYNIDTYPRSLSVSEIGKLEDEMTIKMAKIHGTEYVRGGGYCQLVPRWPDIEGVIRTRKAERKATRKAVKRTKKLSNPYMYKAGPVKVIKPGTKMKAFYEKKYQARLAKEILEKVEWKL